MSRAAFAAVLLVGAVGCGGTPAYPPDLTFPPRADRLVLRTPASQPSGPGEPGQHDAELAGLDALGGKTLDPATVPAAGRDTLGRFLADAFGTPAAPVVGADGAADLGLTPDRLAEGARLFRRHCLHCHGLTGDGGGPSGQWIYPRPRDFRHGAFKFVASGDGGKPRADDLRRTIRDGVKGTAMPAFGLLPEDQRDLMAGYVTYLSLRGESEFRTLAASTDDGDAADDPAGFALDRLADALAAWRRAEATPPAPAPPPDGPEAIRRGYELFTAAGRLDCLTCHEDFGRKATYRYDVWGTAARPKNLTEAGFKGGDKPEELFHRVRHGIQPVGMPAHPGLTDSQVWDVVRFVRALPYPTDLPADVRAKIYPN